MSVIYSKKTTYRLNFYDRSIILGITMPTYLYYSKKGLSYKVLLGVSRYAYYIKSGGSVKYDVRGPSEV
jgi:hypothetical protein